MSGRPRKLTERDIVLIEHLRSEFIPMASIAAWVYGITAKQLTQRMKTWESKSARESNRETCRG